MPDSDRTPDWGSADRGDLMTIACSATLATQAPGAVLRKQSSARIGLPGLPGHDPVFEEGRKLGPRQRKC